MAQKHFLTRQKVSEPHNVRFLFRFKWIFLQHKIHDFAHMRILLSGGTATGMDSNAETQIEKKDSNINASLATKFGKKGERSALNRH